MLWPVNSGYCFIRCNQCMSEFSSISALIKHKERAHNSATASASTCDDLSETVHCCKVS